MTVNDFDVTALNEQESLERGDPGPDPHECILPEHVYARYEACTGCGALLWPDEEEFS